MKYHTPDDVATRYQSILRAEDGLQQNARWNALCEGVLIPIGFIVVILLVIFIIILIRF
jgi:hypothetical protein